MKRGKHPTNSRRGQRQRLKERYAKIREEAQLAGLIPVEPEGAVRDEKVSPSAQTDPPLPVLDSMAARRGWATPEEKKPKIVDALVNIALGDAVEMGPEGIVSGPSPKTQVAAAKALTEMDQVQWERENPDSAGKAKGGVNVVVPVGVSVENNTNMTVFGSIDDLLRKAREQREGSAKPEGKGANDDRTEPTGVDGITDGDVPHEYAEREVGQQNSQATRTPQGS